jgi:transposase
MIKQNKHRKTYGKDFKLMAVRMKLEGGYSNKAVVETLGIPCLRMLKRWVSKYRKYGEGGLEEQRGKMSAGRPRKRPLTAPEEMHKRIRRLEMENQVLKKLLELTGRDVLPR